MNPIFLHVVRLQYAFEYLRGILKRLRVLEGIYIMLYVCSNLKKYSDFKKSFLENHDTVIDLSRVPSTQLVNECDSITDHHGNCSVFLGYLEPGWMLEAAHQTRIRKLIRKFDVGMVTFFPESIPFSWKNEIHTYYPNSTVNQNGNSNSIDNGCSIQDQSNI